MKHDNTLELLNQAAICWNKQSVETDSCYWNIVSTLEQHNLSLTNTETTSTQSISYETLILLTIQVVQQCQELLVTCCSDENKLGLPIAIAIPEGPLLPVAVLTVHVLNYSSCKAILVPVDPSNEAKERLCHILADVRPVLYLVAGNCQEPTFSYTAVGMDGGGTTQVDLKAQTKVVDFSQLVQDSICKIRNQDANVVRNHLTREESSWSLPKLILECIMSLTNKTVSCETRRNRISHIVYTSGTTGKPKGCVCSIQSLQNYIEAKNKAQSIDSNSIVLLASSLSFDPCFSDILACFHAKATLAICRRSDLVSHLDVVLRTLKVTHVLCTPSLWSLITMPPSDFPHLQVVALGGEFISKRIRSMWAGAPQRPKLMVTYGVTEACVYQTCGQVSLKIEQDKHYVGVPLDGCSVSIMTDTSTNAQEVVLYGNQVDEFSSYLNQPELTRLSFQKHVIDGRERYTYMSGDCGKLDPDTGQLYLYGRIQEDMVKVNGVRVELGEIESALVDDESVQTPSVVASCLAKIHSEDNNDDSSKQVHAYLVLGKECRRELNLQDAEGGILCTAGPLLTLLQARAQARVKPGCRPTCCILIPRIPLSPTGKSDRTQLISINKCVPMQSAIQGSTTCITNAPLKDYGVSGPVVASHLIEFLNLQPCQLGIVVTSSSFAMLGGDSLAATRIVRALYAYHHDVFDSRFLGGPHGVLEGPLAAIHLLQSKTLGDYVDWLDENNMCRPKESINIKQNGNNENDTLPKRPISNADPAREDESQALELYDALIEAATLGQTLIALALLDIGADPNTGNHKGRLAKVHDRKDQRQQFKSNPLHLACSRADVKLVQRLLAMKCRYNSPDATGSFPIHLACGASGSSSTTATTASNQVLLSDEDERRRQCIELILNAEAPLSMRDCNKQTVLHCAARSGHVQLLQFLLHRWKIASENGAIQRAKRGSPFDWRDRWQRTPVHWAVLNARVEALRILVEHGCSTKFPKPRQGNEYTSLQYETPMEICNRLYNINEQGRGREMMNLLERGASW